MKLESRQEIVMLIIVAMPQQSRTLLSSVQLEIPLLFYGETPVTNALKKNLLDLCYINAMDPQYHYF